MHFLSDTKKEDFNVGQKVTLITNNGRKIRATVRSKRFIAPEYKVFLKLIGIDENAHVCEDELMSIRGHEHSICASIPKLISLTYYNDKNGHNGEFKKIEQLSIPGITPATENNVFDIKELRDAVDHDMRIEIIGVEFETLGGKRRKKSNKKNKKNIRKTIKHKNV